MDRVRNEWIHADPDDWLAHHRFYDGVIERLRGWRRDGVEIAVASTKDTRFLRTLLERQGLVLPEADVIGRESPQRRKHEVLRDLADIHGLPAGGDGLWFVEDRLETLEEVAAQPELSGVRLFLADWGYNTPAHRARARRAARIDLLSLTQFTGDFSGFGSGRP